MTQIQEMKLQQDFDQAGEHLSAAIGDVERLRDAPAAFGNNAAVYLDSALADLRNALDCAGRARVEIERLQAKKPAQQKLLA